MDEATLYELVTEAMRDVLNEERGRSDVTIERGMTNGRILFEDDQGREVRAVSTLSFFKKIVSVRDKLRVLEQKVNSNKSLSQADKAEMQVQITRAYGSLTTFNFYFRDEEDKFRGTGG
jgi:hypothetical protein